MCACEVCACKCVDCVHTYMCAHMYVNCVCTCLCLCVCMLQHGCVLCVCVCSHVGVSYACVRVLPHGCELCACERVCIGVCVCSHVGVLPHKLELSCVSACASLCVLVFLHGCEPCMHMCVRARMWQGGRRDSGSLPTEIIARSHPTANEASFQCTLLHTL